ncbi:MAG: hypothetical protein Fur0018_14950 [Anaerolineales bacterium]
MRNIHVVLFDLGHTLLYFDGDWPQVFLQAQAQVWQAFDQAGLSLPREVFLENLRTYLEAYYRERESEFIEHTTAYILRNLLKEMGYGTIPADTLQAALTAMYATTQAHWHLVPGAHETLHTLQARGYSLGLISNAAHDDDVQTLVDRHALRSFFEIVLTSAAAGVRKPNPRIFNMALQHWGIPPRQALIVGDTLGADILGGQYAGLHTAWVTAYADTPANRAHRETIFPEYQFENLSALLKILP